MVKGRSLPAAAVEAAPLVAAWEGVPGSGSAGTAPREAAQVGRAAGSPEAGQSRNWLTGFGSGLVGGRGFRPLALQLLSGSQVRHSTRYQ
jgi:hypothetical protein